MSSLLKLSVEQLEHHALLGREYIDDDFQLDPFRPLARREPPVSRLIRCAQLVYKFTVSDGPPEHPRGQLLPEEQPQQDEDGADHHLHDVDDVRLLDSRDLQGDDPVVDEPEPPDRADPHEEEYDHEIEDPADHVNTNIM